MNVEIEPMVSADEVARRLGVSSKTVTKMARDGDIPGYKLRGWLWRFRWSEVEKALAVQLAK